MKDALEKPLQEGDFVRCVERKYTGMSVSVSAFDAQIVRQRKDGRIVVKVSGKMKYLPPKSIRKIEP